MQLAGSLDDQSAREMMEAIEEGCERVDLDEW
jgi:anti-anti-sigma regulatory factor